MTVKNINHNEQQPNRYVKFRHISEYSHSLKKKKKIINNFFNSWSKSLIFITLFIISLIVTIPPKFIKEIEDLFRPLNFVEQIYNIKLKNIALIVNEPNKTTKNKITSCVKQELKNFYQEKDRINLFASNNNILNLRDHINKKCPIIEEINLSASFYPSLKIEIIPKRPAGALPKEGGEFFYLVDKNGEIIELNKKKSEEKSINSLNKGLSYQEFSSFNLPILFGKYAENNFYTIIISLNNCKIDKKNFNINNIHSMLFIAQRRWDIYLKNGIKIKLPENKENNLCRAIDIWLKTRHKYPKAKYVDLRLTSIDKPLVYYN